MNFAFGCLSGKLDGRDWEGGSLVWLFYALDISVENWEVSKVLQWGGG